MVKKIGIIIPWLLSLLIAGTLLAQTVEKSENNTNGVKEIRPGYQVFPDGKMGNTLYKDKKKLISRDDLILKDIEEAPDGYVYYGIDQSDNIVMGFTGIENTKFNEIEGKFYELVSADGKHRLYRVIGKKEIQNLLPRSNTASGLVYNKVDKAAFFHITKGEVVETEDGKERYQFTFKIHIVKDGDSNIIHLPDSIADFRSRLKLDWINKNTLQYTLSNDQKETIVIK